MNPHKARLATLFSLGFAFAIAGCTNGQGEVDVTASNVASFPAPPAALQAAAPKGLSLTTDAAVTLDLKDDLASLGGLGSLSASVTKNTVSGEGLTFVHHIHATIASADGTMPETTATDVDVPSGSSEVDLPLAISDEQLLAFLTEGKAVVHFYLTGAMPDRAFSLTHTIVAHVNVALSGPVKL